MYLFLVRHAQARRDQGSDPDLTEVGERQAKLVGNRLSDQGIEMLLCSPLRRALRTAEIISQALGISPVVWPDLMESWDGSDAMTRSRIASMYPSYTTDFPERWWPESERETDLYARASRLEQKMRLLGEDTDRTIAAVSHGTFGAVLISTFLGAPPSGYTRFSQHNCCVSILDIRPGRAKLYRGNDVAHLPPELLT